MTTGSTGGTQKILKGVKLLNAASERADEAREEEFQGAEGVLNEREVRELPAREVVTLRVNPENLQ